MNLIDNTSVKFIGYTIFILIGILLLNSCSNNDATIEHKIYVKPLIMQSYIDSSSMLYLCAINDIKNGIDKDIVKVKYTSRILALHTRLTQTFDSITSAYMNKQISQDAYDQIKHSLFLDSVKKRNQELTELGVIINLK